MLHISYVAALHRKTRKLKFLAATGSVAAGGAVADVSETYGFVIGQTTEAAKFREDYSHVVFVVDNVVREHHEFPDPALAASRARADERAAALAVVEQASAVERANAGAVEALEKARAAREEAEILLLLLGEPEPPASGAPVGADKI